MTRRPQVIAAPKPLHGLGNRLRSVLGSRSLAEATQRDFAYSWPTGRAFGAGFDELWRFPETRLSIVHTRLLSLRHPYRSGDLHWMAGAADDPIWLIRTPHALSLPDGATPWGERLRALDLVPELADRVLSLHVSRLAGRPYVGVMVRTHPHSHRQTLDKSPLSWFIDRMQRIRDERGDVGFFISSDTEEARDALVTRFPDAVSLTDKGEYNSRTALLSSVVDLYLLASSGHLLAPHYSSFPELSAELAGPGLRLETSTTDASRRLAAMDSLDQVPDPLRPSIRVPSD